MNKQYQDFFNQVLMLRAEGIIRHRDITVLIAMMNWIDFDNISDVKNKRLVNITDMDKSDISKSVKTLINEQIVLEYEHGYILNKNLVLENVLD